jgi:hypothetical protein
VLARLLNTREQLEFQELSEYYCGIAPLFHGLTITALLHSKTGSGPVALIRVYRSLPCLVAA